MSLFTKIYKLSSDEFGNSEISPSKTVNTLHKII